MGHLLLAPRWKMYLIQLLRPPPSPFDLQLKSTLLVIVPVDNAHYYSTLFELPYTCSSLSMLSVSTCVLLSRSKLSLISSDPTLIQLYHERGRVAKEIKRDFSTLKAAEGTRQHRRYKKLYRWIQIQKRRLR